jgi:hypothetical protein
MKKFKNERAKCFLAAIPSASLDAASDTLAARGKFNFSYFDVQAKAGQDFDGWNHDELVRLLRKLKEYSTRSLREWQQEGVLAIYGKFPTNSDFTHPKHVPHQALWGRFRLESAVRLAGFIVPEGYEGKAHAGSGQLFDRNTFYVVFLDKEHRFYITEKR